MNYYMYLYNILFYKIGNVKERNFLFSSES